MSESEPQILRQRPTAHFRTFVPPNAREDVASLSYEARTLHHRCEEMDPAARERGDRRYLRLRSDLADCARTVARLIEEGRIAHVEQWFKRTKKLPPSASDAAGENDCPVCLDPVREGKDAIRAACCGTMQCKSCSKAVVRHEMKAMMEWLFEHDDVFANLDRDGMKEMVTDRYKDNARCILCRKKFMRSERELLWENAEKGHAWAQQLLSSSLILEGKAEEGFPWLIKAASQEYTTAEVQLAMHVWNGVRHGDALDDAQVAESAGNVAVTLMLNAAGKGNLTAQSVLGEWYINGGADPLLPKDVEDGVRFLTLSASRLECSQFQLANIWMEGNSVQEKERALYWLRKAAERGHAEAQCYLAKGLLMRARYYFDKLDWPGYSPIPAATRWARMAVEKGNDGANLILKSLEAEFLATCAACKISKEACDGFFLCRGCQAAGYCSKSCERTHWEAGHKADCCCDENAEESSQS